MEKKCRIGIRISGFKFKGEKLYSRFGFDNNLFSETKEAAVTCNIIKPEFNPGFSTRKGGNPNLPSNRLKILLSLIVPNPVIAIAAQSNTWAKASP